MKIDGLDCFTGAARIHQNLGYLAGELAFLDDLSGKQMFQFIAELNQSRHDSYLAMMERFGLNPQGKIKKMSKGMKQKIGIVCAFMNDPDVIILDEPTSGLDVINALEIRKMIKELSKTENMSFLLSSHNMLEIEFVSDRVGIIAGGRLLAVGKINELKEKYNSANLEEVFEKVVKQNEIS